jgi:hypothetical protein
MARLVCLLVCLIGLWAMSTIPISALFHGTLFISTIRGNKNAGKEQNLASFDLGARVLPMYTSYPSQKFPWSSAPYGTELDRLNDILNESSDHQYCWNIQRLYGRVGIALTNPGLIRRIVVEHDQQDITTAPRNIRVWALGGIDKSLGSPTIPHPPIFSLLASVTFQATRAEKAQSFTLSDTLVPIHEVIIEFTDNWGHSKLMCLRGLRIYGADSSS